MKKPNSHTEKKPDSKSGHPSKVKSSGSLDAPQLIDLEIADEEADDYPSLEIDPEIQDGEFDYRNEMNLYLRVSDPNSVDCE